MRHSPLNTRDSELDRFRFRLAVASAVVLLAFLILIGRFFYLQVLQHDYYTTRAEDNRISLVPIVPNRGVIVDRNDTVLARNYSAFTLEITPSKVADLDATISMLQAAVDGIALRQINDPDLSLARVEPLLRRLVAGVLGMKA